jgi:hypothetical protein
MKELKINVPDGYEIDKDKSSFENIVFKKKSELPKSWEELNYIQGYWVAPHSDINGDGCSDFGQSYRNRFRTREQAEASIALAQLSQLRDVYRQGWVPDWELSTSKYCVVFVGNNLNVFVGVYDSEFLSFKDRKTAELFLENFRDLIEQAKPLMS